MHYLRFVPFFFLFFACRENTTCEDCSTCGKDLNVPQETLAEAIERKESGVTPQNDLREEIEKIETTYGEQWDFCDCVIKGDSLNKALTNDKLSDKELDLILKRFDEIDKKCQAFKIIDPNRTPKERSLHEKKVKKCLKEAGVY